MRQVDKVTQNTMKKRVFLFLLGVYDFNLTKSNLISFGSEVDGFFAEYFLVYSFSGFMIWRSGKGRKEVVLLLQRRESLHSNGSRRNERCDVGISCIGIGEMILPDGVGSVDWSGVTIEFLERGKIFTILDNGWVWMFSGSSISGGGIQVLEIKTLEYLSIVIYMYENKI
jgi:hypothetical protein